MGLLDIFSKKKKKYEGIWGYTNDGKASIVEIKEKDGRYFLSIYGWVYYKIRERINGEKNGHQVCEIKYELQKEEYANLKGYLDVESSALKILGLPITYTYLNDDVNCIICSIDEHVYHLVKKLDGIKLELENYERNKILSSGFYAETVNECSSEFVRIAKFKF